MFIKPDFSSGNLELRHDENDIICIYATEEGLKTLSNLCMQLIKDKKMGHIHLEDYQLLTKNSKIGTIAIFG